MLPTYIGHAVPVTNGRCIEVSLAKHELRIH